MREGDTAMKLFEQLANLPDKTTLKLMKLVGWGARKAPDPHANDDNAKDPQTMREIYRTALEVPRDRIKRYDFCDELDRLPEITSILDTWAEEASQVDREKQASVWITAKNRKIERSVESFSGLVF